MIKNENTKWEEVFNTKKKGEKAMKKVIKRSLKDSLAISSSLTPEGKSR